MPYNRKRVNGILQKLNVPEFAAFRSSLKTQSEQYGGLKETQDLFRTHYHVGRFLKQLQNKLMNQIKKKKHKNKKSTF